MGLFSSIWSGVRKLFGVAYKLIDWLIPEIEVPPVTVQREGSNNPLPVLYGQDKIGGIVVHKWVTDGPATVKNEYLHLIVAWCVGEIESVEQVFFNDIEDTDDRFTVGGIRLWDRWDAVGSDTQTAIPEAVANISNWTTDHRGRGVAHSYFRLRMDSRREVWRGEPKISAVIKGKKVFDPRTSTTIWSDNPAICLLDFLKSESYGKGLADTDIDEASFIAMANLCDQEETSTVTRTIYVPDADPTAPPIPQTTVVNVTQKRFTLNMPVLPQEGVTNAVNQIRKQFRASLPQGNGVLRLEIERDKDSVMSFDESSLAGEIDYESGSKSDRYNQVTIRFINKDKGYEKDEVTYPASGSTEYTNALAADNGIKLEASFEFEGIRTSAEALQMAEVVFKRSRVNGQVAITTSSKGILIEPSDVFDITDDSYGWVNKEFRAITVEPQDGGDVNIVGIEFDPAVYPWTGATFDETIGGTWLGNPAVIAAVTSLTLTPDTTLVNSGLITWVHDDNAFLERYNVIVTDSSDNVVYDVDRFGKSWSLPLVDPGEYTISVFAIGTLGNTSAETAIIVNLDAPASPSALNLTPSDWEILVEPFLAGIGLGTVFEYDWIQGDGTGHTPSAKARGKSFVVPALIPNTQYTVFARSINAYGESSWVSETTTTTETGDQVDPFITPIEDELEKLDDILAGADNLLEQVAQDILEIRNRADVKTLLREEERQRIADIVQVNADLDTLNNTTLPALQDELDAAELELADIDSRFPIDTVNIADDAISAPKILANAVTAVKILAGAVTTDKMTANSINGDRIAANTLAADKIIANSITAAQIAALAITTAELAAEAVTADKVAASAITTDKLDANAVTAAKIAALTITAAEIAAETITGAKIAARTIGADRIVANSLTAGEIAALTITADEIAANAITATKLEAEALYNQRQVTKPSGSDYGWILDPANVELPSDITVWYGDTTLSVANRNKDNGLFWVADDGSYSRDIERDIDISYSDVSAFGTWVTVAELSHESLGGLCQLSASWLEWNGTFSVTGTGNSASCEARIIDKDSNVVWSRTLDTQISGSGTVFIVVRETDGSSVIINEIDNNTSNPKFVDREYKLQLNLTVNAVRVSGSLSVINSNLGYFNSLEVRPKIV